MIDINLNNIFVWKRWISEWNIFHWCCRVWIDADASQFVGYLNWYGLFFHQHVHLVFDGSEIQVNGCKRQLKKLSSMIVCDQ